MKSFAVLVIQLLGYACLMAVPISLLNFYFDWHIGIYDAEVPGEPGFAIFILVFGLIVSAAGYYLNKRVPD